MQVEAARQSPDSQPSAEEVRAELQRIFSSGSFRGSIRLKQFLSFLVERTLDHPRESLKEYVVGVEVFGRGDSFDPRLDTIVRTEARKLRARLSEYYAEKGRWDRVLIELPKGSYTPSFRYNPGPAEEAEDEAEHQDAENGHLLQMPRDAQEYSQNVATSLGEAGDLAAGIPTGTMTHAASWHRSRWVRAAAFVTALVCAGWAGYSLRSVRPAQARTIDSHSIAVAPFANLTPGAPANPFIAGLANELVDSLSQIPGVKISPTFQLLSEYSSLRDAGAKLNVRYILTGSVQSAGNRIRVIARLDDTQTGYSVWSNSYDRALDTDLDVQSEISDAIVSSLSPEIDNKVESASSLRGVAREDPAHLSAGYQDLARANSLQKQQNPRDLRAAVASYEKIISEDPRNAKAYAGLADCYIQLTILSDAAGQEAIEKARAAAEKAVSLNDRLAEAHLALARVFEFDFDWIAANRELKAALDLDPGNAAVHTRYADWLSMIGLTDQAVIEEKKALALDPGSSEVMDHLGWYLYWLRRYDAALEQFRAALRIDPNYGLAHAGLGITYVQLKMYPEGLAEMKRASELLENGPYSNAELAYGYAAAGNVAVAQQALKDMLDHPGPRETSVQEVASALIYIGLGDRDHAFDSLQKAVNQHDTQIHLLEDPLYDPLRSDPRFEKLLSQMRLN